MNLSQDFKKQARSALKGHWFVAIIASFIAAFFGALNGSGVSFSFSTGSSSSGNVDPGTGTPTPYEFGSAIDPDVLLAIVGVFLVIWLILLVVSIILWVIGRGINVGYSKFNINLIDSKPAKIRDIFDSFSQLKTSLVASILMAIYTMLWSMLFIIPGIIATYSYAMTSFVLAENPEMSANEAIRESKRLMKGNKWRLFCLQLSFIGLMIIGALTLGIGLIWIIPYQQATFAAFYRDICPAKDEVVA